MWYTATNTSRGTLSAGDVVIVDTSADDSVTPTAGDNTVCGVVLIGGANGATVYVAVAGLVDVNTTATGYRGQWLRTSTEAGRTGSVVAGTANWFGIAVESCASGGTAKAIIRIPCHPQIESLVLLST